MNDIDDSNAIILAPIIERAKKLADEHKQNRSNPIPIIAVAGSKGSGKSYCAHHLYQILLDGGCNVFLLKQNGFIPFKEIDSQGLAVEPRMRWHELTDVLKKITAGTHKIDIPFRDKSSRPFTIGHETSDFTDIDLVIFDGTFSLTDVTTYNFFSYATFGVFIKTSDENLQTWRWQRHTKKPLQAQKTKEQFDRDWMHDMEIYRKYVLPTEQNATFIISKDAEHRYTLVEK